MYHDKSLIEKRFARSLHRYHTMAVVQRRIADRLSCLIPECDPRLIVEIGAGSGFLTERLLVRFPEARIIANDITSRSGDFLPSEVEFVAADGELMDLPSATDLVASASTLQWFDDLPRFIKRTHKALTPGGVLAVATFGRQNFAEIAGTLEYYTLEQIERISCEIGFSVCHSEEWIEQMEFETPLEVLRHIKATGVNAVSSDRWTSGQLHDFIENYPAPATLTFHPIIVILCKK